MLAAVGVPAAAMVMYPRSAPYTAPIALGVLAYSAPVWMLPGEPDGCGLFDEGAETKTVCQHAKWRNTAVAAGVGLLLGLAARDFAG
jgi:hypothetical protein